MLILEKKFGYKLSCFSVYRRWNKKTAKSMLKNVPTTWVYCPCRPQFYISFLLTERKSEIKMFFTDSQPGYVLRMFLKFCLILARPFLQKCFYKKKKRVKYLLLFIIANPFKMTKVLITSSLLIVNDAICSMWTGHFQSFSLLQDSLIEREGGFYTR